MIGFIIWLMVAIVSMIGCVCLYSLFNDITNINNIYDIKKRLDNVPILIYVTSFIFTPISTLVLVVAVSGMLLIFLIFGVVIATEYLLKFKFSDLKRNKK